MRDFGGEGPIALLHHANGFCKETLALLVEPLRAGGRVIAMDARGHGDSSRPEGPDAYSWRHFSDDVVAVAQRLVAEQGGAPLRLGLGHSFGGTSMLGAAAARHDLFERLVLVDPVTPPPAALAPPERAEHTRGLVDRASRRRADWPSHSEARAWFAERDLFADWLPEALDLYVHHGLRTRADGSVVLKCPPEVEATVFSGGGAIDVFDLARDGRVPTLYLWAARGNFPRPVYERLAASMRSGRVETLDAGHLIPMEAPALVVDATLRFLSETSSA